MRPSGWQIVFALAALLAWHAAGTHRAAAQTAPAGISLYAAGSLKPALTQLVQAFTRQTNITVKQIYGPSGSLRTRIESGEPADVFASADVANPQALADAGKLGPVSVFTHNSMCLLAKTGSINGRSVVDIMLDPAVRLITSTPKADPAGDYAEQIFAKIDAQQPGSLARLDAKALRLVGGPNAATIPDGTDAGTYLLLDGNRGDAFLAYCSGFVATAAAHPAALRVLPMPPALALRADYGLAVRGGSPGAQRLRDFILSDSGQAILLSFGFSPN